MWCPDLSLRRSSRRRRPRLVGVGLVTLALAAPCAALLHPWQAQAVAGSAAESALFRAMTLPGISVLFPRPPAEAVARMDAGSPAGVPREQWLLLRSQTEEAALDLAAAQRDLEAAVAAAPADAAPRLALADFYHRRAQPEAEFHTLLELSTAPEAPEDAFKAPASRPAWQALEHAFRVSTEAQLPTAGMDTLWQHWIDRYPKQPAVYARAFTWNLNAHREAAARGVVERYRQAFPQDPVFPLKASALLALAAGGPDAQARAFALYDAAFQPLWPHELLNSYFDLLAATHGNRRFAADAEARLAKNPDDLDAAARLFLFHQHDGHPERAVAVLEGLQRAKEPAGGEPGRWTPDELYTVAQLYNGAQLYPQAARFNFALYHAGGTLRDGRTARETGLAAMVSILLAAPDQPIALGSSNLGIYRDIGALDGGPGLWNGILSLWLNGQPLGTDFAEQESRAQPYFHRSKAAVLLQRLDTEAPASGQRPALHAELIQALAAYGEDAALLREGEHFLRDFPAAPERVAVALAMADADARTGNTTAEFASYDHLLSELGRATGNMPLSAATAGTEATDPASGSDGSVTVTANNTAESADAADTGTPEEAGQEGSPAVPAASAAFNLDTGDPAPQISAEAAAYALVLDRYLGRLTATNQLPAALAVLRRELDRNPGDPKLYERLAAFLAQNNLSAQQEEVFRAAIARFGGTTWYDKLARFYLRERRQQAFAALTRQVTGIFSGTELEQYFATVRDGGPQLFLELNLYAHQRFPHDLAFTSNLLSAYTAKPTADRAAWERLLRQCWWQSPELTTSFFAWLSETGQLEKEAAALGAEPPVQSNASPVNTAAVLERAQIELWRSHFEQASPLMDRLSDAYPADTSIGTSAADLNRSLAWLDPAGPGPRIAKAVGVEDRLLRADSSDTTRLIRIGDILADHAEGSQASYAPSAAYWRRAAALEPGNPSGYLDAATVFWDYFQFSDALQQIQQAREHAQAPTLFAYEAGVILEDRHDLSAAVQEYVRAILQPVHQETLSASDRQLDLRLPGHGDAAAPPANDPATDRLVALARRPATELLVDRATASALDAQPDLLALRLRLAVLTAEHRQADEQPLLLAAIRRAGTPDAAADLAALTESAQDAEAHEAVLRRQAELTPDPVEKLQFTYDLVHAYQAADNRPAAVALVDATYKANPRILGVVRFTVDFDWSNQRQKEAVDTLLGAASQAEPTLARRFTTEAAEKANARGDWRLGRSIADRLLQQNPYDPQLLAIAAASYTTAGDTAGLEAFYRARLRTLDEAALPAGERRLHTAQLRRGLITALAADKRFPAALEQYLALLAAYPEDGDLVREVALFSFQTHQEPELRAAFARTTGSSPRDARWFIASAQTEELLGNAPAALEGYSRAVALRPERVDLYIAKARLEERDRRFDAAVADYTRLYQLSYKDPQWMRAAATAQARQGHTAAAVDALSAGYLRGSQTTPHDLLTVASQLEQWNMMPEAVSFADRAAQLAGPDLLAGASPVMEADDLDHYVRVLTRARKTTQLFTTLHAALTGAALSPHSPAAVGAQVRSSGLASVADADWRRQYVQARQQRAAEHYDQALVCMGQTLATFGTPGDRSAYVAALSAHKAADAPAELASRWIPAAHAADLGELEAAWRLELLGSASLGRAREQLQPLTELQQARLQFAKLADELTRFLTLHPKLNSRNETVTTAAQGYAAAGNVTAEMRLLGAQRLADPENAALRDRYLELLSRRSPELLVALARNPDSTVADAAVTTALENAPPGVALAAVGARGSALPPVWRSSTTGLAGLYLGSGAVEIRTAFRTALQADATVGQRLAQPLDTTRTLAGDPWFYAAARYAQWELLSTPEDDAPEFLAAELEGAPTLEHFLALVQTDAEAGRLAQALEETAHVLELFPDSPDALDARAELLWRTGDHPAAIAAWRSSLAALRAAQEQGPAPENFWTGFRRITGRVRQHDLFPLLRDDMGALLRAYLARNGTYRSNELLHAALAAAPDANTAVPWLLDLASAASDPSQVLEELADAPDVPTQIRQLLLARALRNLQANAPTLESADTLSFRVTAVRSRLVHLQLLDGKYEEAFQVLGASPASFRSTPEAERLLLVAAAGAGHLPAVWSSLEEPGAVAPAAEVVRSAAAQLAQVGRWKEASALLEWSYARGKRDHTLVAADDLTLAEARLHTGNVDGAVTLLRQMSDGSLLSGEEDRYANEDAGAMLLESMHLPGPALPFLVDLSAAVPWEPRFELRLAEARLAAGSDRQAAVKGLLRVARNSLAPYPARASAAKDLALASVHGGAASHLGAPELDLLASSTAVTPQQAQQPFFVEARVAAAHQVQDPALRLRLLTEAVAIAPSSGEAGRLRLEVLDLALSAGNPATAEAVLDQALNSRNAAPAPPPPGESLLNSSTTTAGEEPLTASSSLPPLPAEAALQSRARQGTLAASIGRMYVQAGEFTRARSYLVFAADQLQPEAKPQLQREMQALDAALRLRAANAARRPLISKNLDQPRVVRTRLHTAPDLPFEPEPAQEAP